MAHFNVLKFNNDYQSTVQEALKSNADFVSFQEVSLDWSSALQKGLEQEYPYYHLVPSDQCCFGIAVFSKHPLTGVDTPYIGGIPNISGTIELDDTSIQFVTAHTPSPVGPANYHKRNHHIRQLGKYIEQLEGPVLAIGDFNAVPWDDSVIHFSKKTGLKDSRKELSATYPSWSFIPLIPIDYIFHSKEIRCHSLKTIDSTSSDHYGIVGTYSFSI